MGAVFAIQVRTGFEVKAKEMLKHVLLQSNVQDVKGIYALETYTEFINAETKSVDRDSINEEDISNHLLKERYSSAITNKRLQLEAIDRYDSPEYRSIKKQYKKEINELQRKVSELRKRTKSIHSVMSGYLLIELKSSVTYLPDLLWSLIKSVPLVSKVLSMNPIPADEVKQFFYKLKDALVPDIEIQFGKELEYDEIDKIETKLLEKVNEKGTTKEEQERLFDQMDDYRLSVVEKIKSLLQKKKEKPVNPFLQKINAFIRRKKEVVSMPLHYLENLYTHEELKFIGERINSKDFLNRLDRLIGGNVVF